MRFLIRSSGAYLAFKAIAVSLAAIVAAMVLSRMALPKLVEAMHGLGSKPPDWVLLALDYRNELPLLPVPGLLLGIAAIMFRPFRGVLAVAALLAAGLATFAIVAMLIGCLAPFYDATRAF
jgi:hypothetical protein